MPANHGVAYLMDPPPEVERDLNQSPEAAPLIIVAAIFFPLATISMAVRLYTRANIVRKLSVDDYLMILAWVDAPVLILIVSLSDISQSCNVFLVAFTLNMTNHGMGKHLWNVPSTPDIYPNFSLNNLLAAIFFCAATGLAKGSILLFYLRIFPIRKIHVLVWIAFTFIIGFSAASVLVNVFSCNPIQGSWSPEFVTTAKCVNRPVFYFSQAGMSIFADIITVLIPLPWLKTLMLPKKQKVGVGILLTMGASVCIISIIRLHSLSVLLHDSDLTYNTVMALMWCILELNLSIIGGSMATIRPFLRVLSPRLFGTNGGGNTESDIYLHSTRQDSALPHQSRYCTKRQDPTEFAPESNGYRTGSEELIMGG